MTHNPQPLHLDAEAAKASEFGQILVNGTFTFSLMVGLSVGDTTLGTLVANLGYDKLVMPKPVFIGDTMRAETEIVELRQSRSRPDRGHRHLPARTLQPAQRNGLPVPALRARFPEAAMRLRSLLFVPGDRPIAWKKRLRLGADALISISRIPSRSRTSPRPARRSPPSSPRPEARSRSSFASTRSIAGFWTTILPRSSKAGPDGLVLPKAEGAASVDHLSARATPGLPIPADRNRDPCGDFPAWLLCRRGRYAAGASPGARKTCRQPSARSAHATRQAATPRPMNSRAP